MEYLIMGFGCALIFCAIIIGIAALSCIPALVLLYIFDINEDIFGGVYILTFLGLVFSFLAFADDKGILPRKQEIKQEIHINGK